MQKKLHEVCQQPPPNFIPKYTNWMGMLELRTTIANMMTKYQMKNKFIVDPESLGIQAGVRPIYQNLISNLSEPNDVALIPTPFYAAFPVTFFIKDEV